MILILIAIIQGLLTPTQNRIEIVIPTAEEETEYVWRTISDINFFEEHNYQISLPEGELIESLKEKAKSGRLEDSDYSLLESYMKTSVYHKSDYEIGYNKIASNKELINKMINAFDRIKKDWTYKKFEKYEIRLTLYGPGGSYDPQRGSILIYTTKEGQFKQYDNPSNTIIHEVIHIGTEESIMNKFQVSHPLKERIIDRLVKINFSKYLPDYRLQSFGDARIDPYLKNKRDIKRLDKIVDQFQREHSKN